MFKLYEIFRVGEVVIQAPQWVIIAVLVLVATRSATVYLKKE